MTTYTGSIIFYQNWIETLCEAANNGTDSFVQGLSTSTYTPSASTHTQLSQITNEVSGSGYARKTLASVTSSQTSGTYTFDAADTVQTASGGSIVARYHWLFDDTLTNDILVLYGLLDTTPGDVTTTDTNTMTVTWNASGIYTLA